MHVRKPILYKSSVSSSCPKKDINWYQLTELAKYIEQTPEAVLDNGVNGGPLVKYPILLPLDLLVSNCDCGSCLGDHLVQDMGTDCYEDDGPAMKLVSTHERQWHAHNCVLAFDWKFFLDPDLVENVYVPQDFGNHLMVCQQKPGYRYGCQPDAQIGRDTKISKAFWDLTQATLDPKLCWKMRDRTPLGNADMVTRL